MDSVYVHKRVRDVKPGDWILGGDAGIEAGRADVYPTEIVSVTKRRWRRPWTLNFKWRSVNARPGDYVAVLTRAEWR